MIELGSTVKDNITGFTGIAVARMTHLHGCVHIAIQPVELKDGRPQKEYLFDEQRIDVVSAVSRTANEPKFSLGSKVKDQISGYEGVITVWIDELYGDPSVTISSNKLHEGKLIEGIHIPESRVHLIEDSKPVVSAYSSATSGSLYQEMSREPASR
jgi:heat shock protein HspQ